MATPMALVCFKPPCTFVQAYCAYGLGLGLILFSLQLRETTETKI